MKIYKTFSPENSIGIIYNSITSNSLRDSEIEVNHLEKIKDYIEFLEEAVLYSYDNQDTLEDLREQFKERIIPPKPKPLEPVTTKKGSLK